MHRWTRAISFSSGEKRRGRGGRPEVKGPGENEGVRETKRRLLACGQELWAKAGKRKKEGVLDLGCCVDRSPERK